MSDFGSIPLAYDRFFWGDSQFERTGWGTVDTAFRIHEHRSIVRETP